MHARSLLKVADMEIEIKQLRETIQDYNQEIQEYKVKEKKLNELQAKVSDRYLQDEAVFKLNSRLMPTTRTSTRP